MAVIQDDVKPVRADSIFFPAAALLMAMTIFAGFAPSFYLRPLSHSQVYLSPLLVIHGAAFTAWPLLMVIQTGLVAANRRDIHRKLGMVGTALATVMLVLGVMAALESLRRHFSPIPAIPPAIFSIVPLAAIVVFALLVMLGIVNRGRPGHHKRYMLLSTVAVLAPALGRMPHLQNPFLIFGLSDIFIVAMAAYDFAACGKVHRATLIAGGILIFSQPGRLLLGSTHLWQTFANWLA